MQRIPHIHSIDIIIIQAAHVLSPLQVVLMFLEPPYMTTSSYTTVIAYSITQEASLVHHCSALHDDHKWWPLYLTWKKRDVATDEYSNMHHLHARLDTHTYTHVHIISSPCNCQIVAHRLLPRKLDLSRSIDDWVNLKYSLHAKTWCSHLQPTAYRIACIIARKRVAACIYMCQQLQTKLRKNYLHFYDAALASAAQ